MFSVIQFPGSNDDRDLRFAMKAVLGAEARLVWHKDAELPAGHRARCSLPGGFSYGDYLRCGAMARFSPIMAAVRASPTRAGRCSASATASRSCARRASCRACCVRNHHLHFVCELRARARRARARAVHLARRAGPACCGSRSSTARAPTRAARAARRARARTARSCCATCDAAGESTPPPTRTAALANIAGVAQRARQRDGPDAAPRARGRAGASAARTAPCCSARSLDCVLARRGAAMSAAAPSRASISRSRASTGSPTASTRRS